ncbi:MAG: methionyl-tRNA formyltransferase [Patescibacteria group bacterium]
MSNINFVFFGTSEFAVKTLDILIKNGYIPSLVITAPDKPKGRKMIMTPPPAKVFSQKHNFKIIQPERLGDIGEKLFAVHPDLFIVASYGKIIPKYILDLPKFGTINVHPSLLPKFRGPSPIQSFILSGEEKTGVTIMLMDEQVDHGAILSQQNLEAELPSGLGSSASKWTNAKQLEEFLAELGGEMLVEVIPKWINGEIKFQEQNHDLATFTKKIAKEDGLVDLEKDTPEIIYRKFLAFQPWPGIYYFVKKDDKDMRMIITDMELKDGELEIKKVKPEGKNEVSFDVFSKLLKHK